MAIKLLISGVSNSGKTTVTKSLDPKTTLVISRDGKNYPYPLPHTNVPDFETAEQLTELINEKIVAFNEKLGYYPTTIVIDSISKIFDDIYDSCNSKFTGFNIYSALDKQIHHFMDYIQSTLIGSDINVIMISHAVYDADTTNYNLVGKGSFSKRGGALAEVDQAVFIETKANKRIVHHRSTKFPARTTLESLPDNESIESYNLANHMELLSKLHDDVVEFEF